MRAGAAKDRSVCTGRIGLVGRAGRSGLVWLVSWARLGVSAGTVRHGRVCQSAGSGAASRTGGARDGKARLVSMVRSESEGRSGVVRSGRASR